MCEVVGGYLSMNEQTSGFKLQLVRLDGAEEHKSEITLVLQVSERITLEGSLFYTPQSNGRAERLAQELSLRALLIVTNSGLPDTL